MKGSQDEVHRGGIVRDSTERSVVAVITTSTVDGGRDWNVVMWPCGSTEASHTRLCCLDFYSPPTRNRGSVGDKALAYSSVDKKTEQRVWVVVGSWLRPRAREYPMTTDVLFSHNQRTQ